MHALRQAACYGVGLMAEKGAGSYAEISNDCLQGLKVAIEQPVPANEKKSKVKQYYHARDNAVSALGKIIKFQHGTVDPNVYVPHWISMLPLQHDADESKIQNEILASLIETQPVLVLGQSSERLEKIILILGEVL